MADEISMEVKGNVYMYTKTRVNDKGKKVMDSIVFWDENGDKKAGIGEKTQISGNWTAQEIESCVGKMYSDPKGQQANCGSLDYKKNGETYTFNNKEGVQLGSIMNAIGHSGSTAAVTSAAGSLPQNIFTSGYMGATPQMANTFTQGLPNGITQETVNSVKDQVTVDSMSGYLAHCPNLYGYVMNILGKLGGALGTTNAGAQTTPQATVVGAQAGQVAPSSQTVLTDDQKKADEKAAEEFKKKAESGASGDPAVTETAEERKARLKYEKEHKERMKIIKEHRDKQHASERQALIWKHKRDSLINSQKAITARSKAEELKKQQKEEYDWNHPKYIPLPNYCLPQ